MDLLKILDAKPEPSIVDEEHFKIDPNYQLAGDYKIATPMSDFQKELIDQIISLHYSDILKFFERLDNDNSSINNNNRNDANDENNKIIFDSLKTMLLNTQLVCSHPYLLINHYFPKSLTVRDLPKRLAETSGKFEILSDLLNQLDLIYNPKDKFDNSKFEIIDIGIIARPGKSLDLIDALCLGFKCNLKRYSGIKLRDSNANQKKNMKINLNIHLFPSDFNNLNEKEIINNKINNEDFKFKFLILFDITTDLDNEFLKKLINVKETKIFRLIPINSVEHITLYFNEKSNSKGFEKNLKPITAAIVVLRDRVGQLPSILKPIYLKRLEFLKKFLADPLNIKWPLPDLPSIGLFTSRDVERSLLTEVKFNFDNEDILKEEEEKRESLSLNLNLNFNFAGKTKMIGHIIQPRFANKSQKAKNYYEEKRLEKKYLTNPLNKDYENLTGISKEIEQNDNDVLTHTLMYKFNDSIEKLIAINNEMETFDKFNDSRIKYFETMEESFNKISTDYNESNKNFVEKTNKIKKINDDCEILNDEIRILDIKINELVDDETNENKFIKEWIIKDNKSFKLVEEIKKLEHKLESNNNESKYMKEEIERAEKSIKESEIEIESQEELNRELNEKIEIMKNDNSIVNIDKIELDGLLEEYNKSKETNKELLLKIDGVFKSLNESHNRSNRHVNYSRNGLLSKKN